MNDAGYTLAEMLVALVIVSLASAGLAAGTDVVMRMRKSASTSQAEARELRRLDAVLTPMFVGAGPYRVKSGGASGWTGDATTAQFDCRSAQVCRVAVTPAGLSVQQSDAVRAVSLNGLGPVRLSYLSAKTGELVASWPPPSDDRLAGMAITGPNGPLAFFPIARTQERKCVLDYALHDCLPSAPYP